MASLFCFSVIWQPPKSISIPPYLAPLNFLKETGSKRLDRRVINIRADVYIKYRLLLGHINHRVPKY
jgi:hypothetical protein